MFLLLFTPSRSVMVCTRTSLPLLSHNLSDVSPIAVASQRWLQSAKGCHNIKAPTKGFGQFEMGDVLGTCAKNSFHILKIFLFYIY